MAKEFLARILTVQNSLTTEGNQDCPICQEKCGTLSPETGIMELEVRLPCNHTVGSACIATWLAHNNTCPLCRREFFPHQSRPYMEYETTQGNGGEERERDSSLISRLFEHSESDDDPIHTALRSAHQLHLSLPVTFLAVDIADSADNPITRSNYSVISLAAAAVYIASHILNQPRSLTDIARLWAINERTLHSVYRGMYLERYEMINETWRQLLGGANLFEAAELLPSLTWPPLEYLSTDGEEDTEERIYDDSDSTPAGIVSFGLVRELFYEYRWDNAHDHDMWEMAQYIVDKMVTMTLDWKTVNPWTLAAACIYMASFLVFQGKSIEQISTVEGVSPASIRNTYRVMYSVREVMIQEEWFEDLSWTRENALYCLPGP